MKATKKNIWKESHGLFFITGLLGLRAVRMCKKMFPGYIYTAILLLAYYFLHSYTILESLELYEFMSNYSMTTQTRKFHTLFNSIFLTIMIVSSSMNTRKIRSLYEAINEIDGKLGLLNIHLNYEKFARIDNMKICDFIVMTILLNLMEYFPQLSPRATNFFILVWIVNYFPEFVNSIAIVNFVIVLTKIRRRFEVMNDFILSAINSPKRMSGLETDSNDVLKLRLWSKIHIKLVKTATSLNEAHEFIVLTSFIFYFITCCSHLHTISAISDDQTSAVDIIVETAWLFFYIGKIAYVTNACHNAMSQANNSSRFLRENLMDVDHHSLRQEMTILVGQIGSRNLQLTACNFFVIDYPLLKMIILVLVGYFVFISQLSASCEKRSQ